MHFSFGLVAATLAGAASAQSAGCVFRLRTTGSVSFPVGQITGGQIRAGTGMTQTNFTWNGNGSLTDSSKRGCWWTPPTSVFQCDVGQVPVTGFSIGCSGAVSYNGTSVFYACKTGNGDSVNVYTKPSGASCSTIGLVADGCFSTTCSSSSSACRTVTVTATVTVSTCPAATTTIRPTTTTTPSTTTTTRPSTTTVTPSTTTTIRPTTTTTTATPTTTTTRPTTTTTTSPTTTSRPTTTTMTTSTRPTTTTTTSPSSTPSGSCPGQLTGAWEFPHLIVPISNVYKNTSYGTQYFAQTNSSTSTVFKFDIPAANNGKTCTLRFLFPTQAQLQTSSFTISGGGNFQFWRLGNTVTATTSWNSAHAGSLQSLATLRLQPGNAYTVGSFPCPGGQSVSFEMDTTDGTAFRYFQDYNPCPIGLYILPN